LSKFQVTSPDGKKFEVNAPDDATDDQVLSYVQDQIKPEEKGFTGAFTEELGNIGEEYKHAFTNPIDTAKGIVQALGAAVQNPELAAKNIGNAFSSLATEFKERPSETAGTFAAQIANPINFLPLGAASTAARMAVKGGKLARVGGTVAGATVGAGTAAFSNVVDEGMRAAAEGRELTPEEAHGAAGLGAGLGGAMSIPVAAISAKPKAKPKEMVDVPEVVPEKLEQPIEQTNAELATNLAEPEVQSGAREWANNTAEGAKAIAYQAGKAVYFRPVQVIRDIGTDAAKQIGDLIYKEERGDVRTTEGPDLIQRRSHAEGEYAQRLDSILDTIRGRLGVNKKDSQAIAEGLNTGKIDKRLSSQLDQSRTLLDDMYNYQIEAGVPIGRVEGFFPRVYDVPRLMKHKGSFIKMLREAGNPDPESTFRKIVANDGMELDDVHTNRVYIDKYGSRRVMHEGGAKKPAHEKARTLDIEYSKLKPFLINDFDSVMARYIHHATRRAEYARTFGADESILNGLVEQVVNSYAKGEASDNLSVRQAVKAIYDEADALQGRGPRFDNEYVNRLARATGNYSIMTHLPLVALASFPETLAPALHGGVSKYIPALSKGIVEAVWESTAAADRFVTGKRHWKKTEWRREAERMGIVTQHSMREAWQRRFGGATGKITTKFMRATMLEQMTNIQKIVANEMAKSMIPDLLKKNTKQAKMELKDFDLGENPSQVDIDYAAQRWAQKVITDPNEATTPLLMQHPGVNLIFQFKRFITTFSNTLLKSLLQNIKRYPNWQKKAQFIAPAVGMVAIAYYTQYLRDWLKYGDAEPSFRKRKDHKERWIDAVDRSGLTGDLSTYYMLANPYRFGFTDSSAKRLFNLLGPVAGDIARTGDIITAEGSTAPKRQARAISKLIPGVNITAAIREPIEKQIEKALR